MGDFDVWLPPEKNNGEFSDSNAYLKWALTNVASMPREQIETVVKNLIDIGYLYHAARCLEISAQQNLGVFFTGNELLSYRYPNFGRFHNDIRTLLEAGCLYLRSERTRTAANAFARAQAFVEEALRQISSYEEENSKENLCLGLAFELAGHCCFPNSNADGISYYDAAEKYWSQSYNINPEEVESWKEHPVTKTVIGCLKQVAKTKVAEETTLIPLMSMDFQTRIAKARELIA